MWNRRLLLGWMLGLAFSVAGSVWAQDSHLYRANATTLHQQGLAFLHERRLGNAIEVLQRAVRINPYSTYTASIYNTLAQAYRQANRPELAMVSYMFATRIQPDFGPYYAGLVETWRQAKRLDAARDQLEETVNAAPRDGAAWYLLGLVAQAQGDTSTQQEAWRQFARLETNSALRRGVCSQVDCQ